jgi:hypothetical protein
MTFPRTLLPAVVGFALLAAPASAQGVLGLKIWNTEYSLDGEEIGDGPFGYLYYVIEDAAGNLLLQYGYGTADGTGIDVSRSDFAVAYTTSQGLASFGAGGRYIRQEFGDATVRYYGPEVMAGVSYPLQGTALAPYASGSLGMFVYDAEFPESEDSDGTVLGYSFNLGLAYSMDMLVVKGGYRLQAFEDDGEDLGDDELSGLFVEISFSW